MQQKYRYHIEGASPVTIRGITIRPTEYFYSNVALFTAADFSANPTLRMDTDTDLNGVWTADTADDEAPAEVSSLAGTVDPTKVVLTWVDPTIADFKEVSITHDQTGGDTPVVVAKGVQTAEFTGLTNAQEYTFTVKTVDEAGNVSSGTTIAKTPATDAAAPAEVTRRNANRNDAPGSKEVTLSWLDPVTADFDHVEITHDQDGATKAVATLTVTAAPTEASTWNIALFGGTPVEVTFLGTESINETATAIRETSFPGYTLSGTDAEVIFTKDDYEDTTGNGVLEVASGDGAGTFGTAVQGVAQEVFIVAKGVQKKKITGLTANTTYLFTIKTVDRAGNASTGVTVAATPK